MCLVVCIEVEYIYIIWFLNFMLFLDMYIEEAWSVCVRAYARIKDKYKIIYVSSVCDNFKYEIRYIFIKYI